MTDDPRAIRVDQFLAHPPSKVWKALTDPELIARWLMPNDFEPVVGHRFTMHTAPKPAVRFNGVVHCEVLAIEQERLLRISWVDRGDNGLDSTVTWRLEPEGRGTRLFVEHAGFDPDDPVQQLSRKIMDGGFAATLRRLDATVAAIPDLRA